VIGAECTFCVNRVLIVYGDLLILFKCDNEALEITTTNACFGASAVTVAEAKKVAPTDLTSPEQKRTETTLDAIPAMKKVCLGLADPAKTVVIGDNPDIFAWTPSDMQVFQGSWLSTPWM
jgi:hypothetical protein